jgi:hypothetical protein
LSLICGYNLPEAERPALEEKLGAKILPEVWDLTFTGELILVVQDLAEAMHKGVLHKPDQVRQREQTEMGSGWIIAVGPQAGQQGHGLYPSGAASTKPQDLLGRHIIYQMYVGRVLRTDTSDDEWETRQDHYVILTDRDIQASYYQPGDKTYEEIYGAGTTPTPK